MNAQNTILFLIIISIRCDEDLKIRIGLPEYICDKDGGIRDVSKDLTTIRLLGKNENVSYKFEVNFKSIVKKCFNTQRCTLLTWKAVRELNRYLNNYSKFQTGLIEINNTMFDPGIKYVINVKVMSRGKVMDEKQLSMDYVDDAVRRKIKKPMASLLLLSPDNSYAYASYVINADVNICSNITSYYFEWALVNNSENVTLFPSRNSELIVPPDTLQASLKYTVKCTLLTDGAPIAQSEQIVNVLSKGLVLRLPVKLLTTRINQDVRVKGYMKDLDNVDGEMKISWSCVDISTNKECKYDSDSNEMDLPFTFDKLGIYTISLEISKGDFTETDFCNIRVVQDSPIVEIEDIEFPTNPSQGVEIQATIYELRTFCTLQWTSPYDDDYEALDLNTVPGDVARVVNVTMKEDFFLHELEEFTNGTVDKRHNLLLPPPTENWEGLRGDVKYLFRLTVTCPPSVEVLNDLNGTGSITTNTDVIIETNAAPKMQPLEVAPLGGEAFVTTFRLKMRKSEDKDEPIFYKFGYILEDEDVILWNLEDVTNCEGTLPYSDDGIQTFVEICDSFGSCGRVLGPLIKTRLPDKIPKEMILKKIEAKMVSEDYPRAFIEAFAILHSYKETENDTRRFISERIKEEIEKYLKMEDENHLKKGANILMATVNEFNSKLKLPETVINKVLELRDKLSENSEKYIHRRLLSFRKKRASSLTLHEIKNYLDISELIITTSNDPNKIKQEKENLRKQLENYMEKLCTNMKKPQVSLELKTVIFSVEKLKKNSLNNFITIPFEGNSWQVSGRIKLGNVIKDSKEKCVGKAIFRDYFEKNGVTFFTNVLNGGDINENADIVIFLPKNKSAEGIPRCLVYYDKSWNAECKTTQNVANFVKCNCKHLGYYYLEYTRVKTSTVVPPSTKSPGTTSLPIAENITTNLNQSSALTSEEDTNGNYDTISYIVIAISVIGIIILAIIVRKIFNDDEDENEDSETFEFPKYAQLHNEEFLNDAHM